jgi:acyl-CoA thioester hydrolase
VSAANAAENGARGIPDATDPAAYKFWVTEQIRFADLDFLGHVNNVAFTVYAESARAAFMHQTGFWVPGARRQNVIARIELDYLRELLYPGEVRVGLRVLKIGRSSFTLGLGLFDREHCAATAVAVIVRTDNETRRSTPLNDEERAWLQPYLSP